MDYKRIMFCPRCGRDNPQKVNYCNECGFALHEIQTFLQKSEGSAEMPETEITGAVGTSDEPAVPVKKENPKKQYSRSTTKLPDRSGETPWQHPVSIQPVPEMKKTADPVFVQPVPEVKEVLVPVSASPSFSVPPGAVPEPSPAATPARIRNPSLAVALSLIPGLGQVYNGNLVRGIILFLATLIGLLILIIPGVAIWIYSIWDAYKTSEKINRGEIPFGPQKN